MATNTISEDLGEVIIQAAEVIGSKTFIKAHVQITVSSDQYKMHTGEVNLSGGANVDPSLSADEQRRTVLAEVVAAALAEAEALKGTLEAWRKETLTASQDAQAPASPVNRPPAGPPVNNPNNQAARPAPAGPRDRNRPFDWGYLTFAPKAGDLNYGDTFNVVADSVAVSANGKQLEFWLSGNQYPVLKISNSSGTIKMWETCFPEFYMPSAQAPTPFGRQIVIPCRATTPPAIVSETGNPFINVARAVFDLPVGMTGVSPQRANKTPLAVATPGFEEI